MNDRTINADVTLGGSEGALIANRYRVVRPLGQGGMGSVWLAEDTQLDNRQVAIKMLPSILVSNRRAYNQLKAEALVSLKLTHPNIAAVRAFEENGGNPFLVEDYIDGQTLDDYLADKGKLNEDETVRLLEPIASALDYAHGEGVVHRDVKPGNIMIRKDGRPFILDFGIAREMQETMTRVTGRISSGTLMYTPPEQLRGDAPQPEQDVYSLAATIYECIMGHPPFFRGQIEYQILNEEPENCSAELKISASIMRGLSKKREKRPSKCAVLFDGSEWNRNERPVTAQVEIDTTADALRYFEDGKYEKAYASLSHADLQNRDIQCWVGHCLEKGHVWKPDAVEAVKWYKASAEKGSSRAQFSLGCCYENGVGVEQDDLDAAKWYRLAAEQGNVDAQYNLAVHYENGEGEPVDNCEAFKWYKAAAEQGDAAAQYELALCFLEGRGCEKSTREGVEWMERAVDHDNADAQNYLGYLHEVGEGVGQSGSEAFRLYNLAAAQGSEMAICNVGECYFNGVGVEENRQKALEWYLKASEAGSERAEALLAEMYFKGNGVSVDEREGLKWLMKSAEHDDAESQFKLGVRYSRGDGVDKDEVKSTAWFRRCAETGDADGQTMMGLRYAAGLGVEQDHAKAVEYFMLAADQGDELAQFHLAECYRTGAGVVANNKKAFRLYEQSAEKGNDDAQYKLALCYMDACGCEKDIDKGVRWLKCAAGRGNEFAQHSLGLCYEHGDGVPTKPEEAYRHFRMAADHGYSISMCKVGDCYAGGIGVPADKAKARKWYSRAAEKGDATAKWRMSHVCVDLAAEYDAKRINGPLAHAYNAWELSQNELDRSVRLLKEAAEEGCAEAQVELGRKLEFGDGVAKSPIEAYQWYRRASEQGFPEAFGRLAQCYALGFGVLPNLSEAIRIYQLGAKSDDVMSLTALGFYHKEGKWVDKDPVAEARCFERAAELGGVSSMEEWARCLETAHGVAEDLKKAKYWYKCAAEEGWADALGGLKRVCEKLNAMGEYYELLKTVKFKA